MNEIWIIVTEGCKACAIAEKLINQAIIDSEINDIQLEVIDCLDPYYYDFIVRQNITDYPTTIFITNGVVKDSFVGTIPRRSITHKIKRFFD